MTLGQWAELSQIVGAIAVVISLVYVGWEIRSNTQASRAATRQAIAETDFKYVGATLDPRVLLEAETKLASGANLSPAESFVLVERQHLNFRIFENAYYQHRVGLLEPETWQRYRWIIALLFATNEPARAMWAKFGPSFDDSFKDEVTAIRVEPFVPPASIPPEV